MNDVQLLQQRIVLVEICGMLRMCRVWGFEVKDFAQSTVDVSVAGCGEAVDGRWVRPLAAL